MPLCQYICFDTKSVEIITHVVPPVPDVSSSSRKKSQGKHEKREREEYPDLHQDRRPLISITIFCHLDVMEEVIRPAMGVLSGTIKFYFSIWSER